MTESICDAPTFLTKFHHEPYAAISPSRPELKQTGRTVLITGASEGIGLAIAKAFVEADAATVIITGRRKALLDAAADKLAQETPRNCTRIIAKASNMADRLEAAKLWNDLETEEIIVDVLCLNATAETERKPLLDRGTNAIWSNDFEMNVRAQLYFTERFWKQSGNQKHHPKYLVHTSTFLIHEWNVSQRTPGYRLTKNCAALMLQLIANDVDPQSMQIVSYNPGPVFTSAAARHGFTKESFLYNKPELAGQFALWLASPEGKFLHGRFVWSEWDVTELQSDEVRALLARDPYLLKIGIRGL